MTTTLRQAAADDIARTNKLCAREPKMEMMRQQVLAVEMGVHMGGWDETPPFMFATYHKPTTNEVDGELAVPHTAVLADYLVRKGRSLGDALEAMAHVLGEIRRGEHREKMAAMGLAYSGDAGVNDLLPRRDGWDFYGHGLMWERPRSGREPGSPTSRCRSVYVANRDGLAWVCRREEGDEPFVTHHSHEDYSGPYGRVIHHLSRMTAAVAANAVPAQPLRPRNPLFRYPQEGS